MIKENTYIVNYIVPYNQNSLLPRHFT